MAVNRRSRATLTAELLQPRRECTPPLALVRDWETELDEGEALLAGMPDRTPAAPQPSAAIGVALLVDDHEMVRVTTAEMLGELGYKVIEARSAEEAAELVGKGFHVDLLVTDHLMPGMSGVDLARIVRVRAPGIPVLLITGYSDPAGIPPGLPCLTKPFRRAQLEESIARLRKVPATA